MRINHLLMQNWGFARLDSPCSELPDSRVLELEHVNLPHVWNRDMPKETGPVLYQMKLQIEKDERRNYLLAFDAVGGTAQVFLNGKKAGSHQGSYARFCLNISEQIVNGENLLQVIADNTRDGKTNPVTGDFTYYGGIYRDVTLMECEHTYFDQTYFGTAGVLIHTESSGRIVLTSRTVNPADADLSYLIVDAAGNVLLQKTVKADQEVTEIAIAHPHLWQGQKDPYCYTCIAELVGQGAILDQVILPFGFRSAAISADRGFLLNGEPLRLHGAAKHQDYEGYGCGVSEKQIDTDFQLIQEIGANAVRFSHYQHPQHAYDCADRMGLVAWAEIPNLAMEDGNEELMENAELQLKELILQNMHHPSICFWGLQNEIGMRGESLETYAKMKQLNALAKELDPTRLTACAEVFSVPNSSELNFIHDAVGYNLYFGWYTGQFADYIDFAEHFHHDNPNTPLAITEYGADCNLQYHTDRPERQDYTEEYQALYHESVYGYLEKMPYLWGTFVWNMFDFSSSVRDEGGMQSRNMKGLVTYDRSIKKDSFYFYKACWSKEPFVHLCGSRYVNRPEHLTSVKVYSNEPEVTLYVNDQKFQTLKGSRIFLFAEVPLNGTALIKAKAATGICDEMILKYTEEADSSYTYPKKQSGNVANWFIENIDKDQISAEGYFSVNDRIMELMANEEALKVLEEYLPAAVHDERTKMFGGMTLLRVIDRSHADLSQQQLKDLNQKLKQIKK